MRVTLDLESAFCGSLEGLLAKQLTDQSFDISIIEYLGELIKTEGDL